VRGKTDSEWWGDGEKLAEMPNQLAENRESPRKYVCRPKKQDLNWPKSAGGLPAISRSAGYVSKQLTAERS